MELDRSIYSSQSLGGLRGSSRNQLAKVLRASGETITPATAAKALDQPSIDAARLLARWAKQGWLQRVRRGIYVAVPIESERADSAPEDAWVIAEAAFSPCFISGWSAAEHWSLTEQVFRSVCVSTARKPRTRKQKLGGTEFVLRTVPQTQFFGLKTVWRGRTRVQVTDPSRTIVDLFSDPSLGGGLRSSMDMLENYLRAKDQADLKLVLKYADQLGNRAVFKRLGFLLQRIAPEQKGIIKECAERLSAGYTKLDPQLASARLATEWRLWLPAGW